MKRRKLGDLEVSAIGLGAPVYAEPDPNAVIPNLQRALERGVNFIDSSDIYWYGRHEEFVAQAIKGRRAEVVLATKFGNIRPPGGTPSANGRPAHVRQACEASLRRLEVDVIDLYYIHRVDPIVPIEDTVGAMAQLVAQGKIRRLGICEAAPATIRRAHETHPMTALQTEYSLWSRDPEAGLLDLCAELGIGFVAYSPLGRGFLTGTITDPGAFGPGDMRRGMPRFHPEHHRPQPDPDRPSQGAGRRRTVQSSTAGARLGAEPAAVRRANPRDPASALARREHRRRRPVASARHTGRAGSPLRAGCRCRPALQRGGEAARRAVTGAPRGDHLVPGKPRMTGRSPVRATRGESGPADSRNQCAPAPGTR